MPPYGEPARREPLAIIGIGCRFPGGVNDAGSFWRLLTAGVDAITEVPEDRWSVERYHDPVAGVPGKTYSRWGGFIGGIDQFEPEFFGISPREASSIDPQQRLLLEVAWEALDDAGQATEHLAGSRTGVFVGISTNDYAQVQSSVHDPTSITAHTATGGALSIAANRISYCLDLRGPSVAVDTACSSSLAAAHFAGQSLWSGESDLALVGGVNILVLPQLFIAFCAAAMLAPDGRCKAFDARADGFVRGEGAGVVVLKRLSRALADRDPVYAVILGSGINQDGRTGGMSAPNEAAQEALLREVLAQSCVAPHAVSYIEAHGTGTAVGDPIEARAIGRVMSTGRPRGRYCALGSVKTNIGHLEAAAGIAGLIKTALVLKHRMIPANLHFVNPNPAIPLDELQLHVPRVLEPWPDGPGLAIAGVNAFGFGGTNAHVVLAEHAGGTQEPTERALEESPRASLLPLSARSPEALQALARSYRDFLGRDGGDPPAPLPDVCHSASLRKRHFDHRLSVVARTREECVERLGAFLAGERRPGLSGGRRIPGRAPKPVFVFAGQGPQWWGMGRELLQTEPVFRGIIEACDALLRPHAGWSLLSEFTADESTSRLQQTAIAQPALFALQVALAELWKSWGVHPYAVVGHSVGEIAAAHVAGALSLEDGVRVVFQRGRCMDLASSKGKMLAVACPPSEAEAAIEGYEDRVALAAINSPTSVTLSGEAEAIEAIAGRFTARGTFCGILRVNYAFHSPQMVPVEAELLASLEGLCPAPTDVPMVSTVTGEPVDGRELDGRYWWRNVREKVRFAGAIDWLSGGDADTFLELSPHPVLSAFVSECLLHRSRSAAVLVSLRRQEDARATMLASLGVLHAAGHPVDWHKVWPAGGRPVRLPGYPWQRQRHWRELEDVREARVGKSTHPLLGRRLSTAEPSWEITLGTPGSRYLRDHRVHGDAVFPAAAYVELAFALAREHLGAGLCAVEQLRFQQALVLPDDPKASIQLVFSPADGTFAIHSAPSTADQPWVLHTTGQLERLPDGQSRATVPLERLRRDLSEEMDSVECYRRFAAMGFRYGPAFQGIERIWSKDGEALGKIHLGDELGWERAPYGVHPALLDASLQVLLGAMPDHGAAGGGLYLPVEIACVRCYGSPGRRVWSHARLTTVRADMLAGDVRVCADDGAVLIAIDGLKCRAITGRRRDARDDMRDLFYEVTWQSQPRAGQGLLHLPADFIPRCRAIVEAVATAVQRMDAESGWSRAASERPLRALSIAYVAEALRDLAGPWRHGDRLTFAALMERSNVASQHRPLVRRFVWMLEQEGYLKPAGRDAWVVDSVPVEPSSQELWQEALVRCPSYLAELTLIGRCGENLAAVLRGDQDPLAHLFPDGSTSTIEHLFQDSPMARPYNMVIQQVLAEAVRHLPPGRPLRVLEVGAGTGGLTTYVLPALPADRTKYVFSDMTQLFLDRGEQRFRNHPFVRFQLLDIEKSPSAQGYEPHAFDVILASDVLHATKSVRDALKNVLELLSSDGLLIMLEAVPPTAPSWLDLVFGLTEGWWKFRDFDIRPDHPLMTPQAWRRLLIEVGCAEAETIGGASEGELGVQSVILACGPCIEPAAQTVTTGKVFHDGEGDGGRWLIFADNRGVAQTLVSLLSSRGEASVVVSPGERFVRHTESSFQIAPDTPEDMERLLQAVGHSEAPWRGAIHLWTLDTPAPAATSLESLGCAEIHGCHGVMHFVQALAKTDLIKAFPRLLLVTRGAQPVGPSTEPLSVAESPLIGIGRTIVNEHPGLHCKMVDLSHLDSADEVRSLCHELSADDPEEEVALRGTGRFVPRLRRMSAPRVSFVRRTEEDADRRSFRLENSNPGAIEQLSLREARRRSPEPGEVEIEVRAASLNFRDVMKALGAQPDDHLLLGSECAGRIVAVGSGVDDVQIGDGVIAFASGTFASHVTTSARSVIRKPASLTFEEAVTIPTAFVTAQYALHHLARIQPGERVLIHAAAGGVGLAALRVARHAGAEIFATAGSADKRELLRRLGVRHVMDSRSLGFADQIMEVTNGRGVDIVLNSLAGPAIAKGIACLAPYGRFLELGKRDIYQNSKVGLWGLRKNVSFFAIDLQDLLDGGRPALLRSLLRDLSASIEVGIAHPLPLRVFPASRTVEAFRHMAQAGHVGKVVVSMDDPVVSAEPLDPGPVAFRPDATYLITGGFGGLGMTLAHWIVEQGGRNIALMGRSGTAGERARQPVSGARVMAAEADVTRPEQVANVLAEIDRTMPPLRGVFHAAMVLDDGLLLQLDRDRFRKVMAPKVDGAWNLHVQTRERPLDFFVLFSSAAAYGLFPTGQGNYVAANTFLDALAHHRRSLGLAATTINLGTVADVGYVARHREIGERLDSRGLLGLSAREVMQALARVLQNPPTQVWLARIDWRRLGMSITGDVPRRLSLLISSSPERLRAQEGRSIRESLCDARPEERADLVLDYIREQVARVLSIAPSKLNADQPVDELGLDSLMVMELRHVVESELGVSLPTGLFLQNPTISQLGARLTALVVGLDVCAERDRVRATNVRPPSP